MKHIRTIALAAMTAMALLAFGVGSASATTLENSKGEHVSEIDASLVGSATLSAGGIIDTCTGGGVKGSASTGGATETVSGSVTTANLTWSGCTQTTATTAGGNLEIHSLGNGNGTVTGETFKVTVLVGGSVSCTYGLTAQDGMVHLGTLTGSDTTPILHIDTTVPKITGSFLCPASGTWQATYHVTNTGITVT